MKKALLSITLVTLVSVLIYSCSSDDDDSAASSVIQTPTPEPDATKYTLTISAGEGGSVSTEGGTYDEGTKVTVTANPKEGYGFAGWTNFESNSSTINITLNSNTSVSASFITLPSLSMVSSSTSIFTKSKKDTLTFETNVPGGFNKLEINSDNGDVEIVSQPEIGGTSGEIKLTYNPQTIVNVDYFRTIAGYDDLSISVFDSFENSTSDDIKVMTQPEPIFNKDYLRTNKETSSSRADRLDVNLIRFLNRRDNLHGCGPKYNIVENLNLNGNQWDVYGHFVMIDIDLDGYDDLVVHPNYLHPEDPSLFTSVKMDIEVYFYRNGEYVFQEILTQLGIAPNAYLTRKFLVGDFDNDGRPDLYCVNSGIDAPPYTNERSFFLYNDFNTNGKFTLVENQFVNYGHNAASGDIDNDGDLDIFQNGRGQGGLFDFVINNGGRSFSQGNLLSNFVYNSNRSTFFNDIYTSELRDLNGDGFLDLLLHGHAFEDKEDDNMPFEPAHGKILFSNSNGEFLLENIKYFPHVESYDLGLDFNFIDIDMDGSEEILVLRTGDGTLGEKIDGGDVNQNIGRTNYYSGYFIQVVDIDQELNLIDITDQYMDGNGQYGVPHGCDNLNIFWLQIGDYDNNGQIDLYGLKSMGDGKPLVRWELSGTKFVKRSPQGTDWMFMP